MANSIPLDATQLPTDWKDVLAMEFEKPYWSKLQDFVAEEREKVEIFPPKNLVYSAFHLTPFNKVRVLIMGQDPYHGEGQAHGLSFSVQPGVALPASLRNIYKELQSDLGLPPSKNGSLVGWAEQGVMMLNAVLTVQAGQPNSHRDKGWEQFTDAVLKTLNARAEPVVFVLWGAYARKKKSLIDTSKHVVIESAHPSPLSAASGFFGSKPFSKINEALEGKGLEPIDWQIRN
jgi:uracil-DNA glycosylase